MKKTSATKQYAVMVEGKYTPSKLHGNHATAEAEAKRLCIVERRTAYVLVAVEKYELNDVKKTKL